jgi:hypothetical protein
VANNSDGWSNLAERVLGGQAQATVLQGRSQRFISDPERDIRLGSHWSTLYDGQQRDRLWWQSTYLFRGILLGSGVISIDSPFFIVGVSCWLQAIISIDSLLIYFRGILCRLRRLYQLTVYLFIRGILLGSGDYINWQSTYLLGYLVRLRRLYQLTVYLFIVSILLGSGDYINWQSTYLFI